MKLRFFLTVVITVLSMSTEQAKASVSINKGDAIQKYVTLLSGDEFKRTGKIVQYFSLNCPICYMVEPYMLQIKKDAKGKVEIEQLHVGASNKSWLISQRAFATLSIMGLDLKYKSQIFDHVKSLSGFSDEQQVFNWSKSYKWHKRFVGLYHSEQVDNYISNVSAQIKKYHLTQVPTFIVNGKYKVLWGNEISKEKFSESLLELYKQSLDEDLHQHY